LINRIGESQSNRDVIFEFECSEISGDMISCEKVIIPGLCTVGERGNQERWLEEEEEKEVSPRTVLAGRRPSSKILDC
jgi:hypothetical protein